MCASTDTIKKHILTHSHSKQAHLNQQVLLISMEHQFCTKNVISKNGAESTFASAAASPTLDEIVVPPVMTVLQALTPQHSAPTSETNTPGYINVGVMMASDYQDQDKVACMA